VQVKCSVFEIANLIPPHSLKSSYLYPFHDMLYRIPRHPTILRRTPVTARSLHSTSSSFPNSRIGSTALLVAGAGVGGYAGMRMGKSEWLREGARRYKWLWTPQEVRMEEEEKRARDNMGDNDDVRRGLLDLSSK